MATLAERITRLEELLLVAEKTYTRLSDELDAIIQTGASQEPSVFEEAFKSKRAQTKLQESVVQDLGERLQKFRDGGMVERRENVAQEPGRHREFFFVPAHMPIFSPLGDEGTGVMTDADEFMDKFDCMIRAHG